MRIAKNIGVVLFYSIVFIAMSFPLIANFTEAIIGQGPDPYQYIWNAFIFNAELSDLSNPFYTHKIMYPDGASLLMHTYTPIIGVANLFIHDAYLATNLMLLLSFTLSAFGAYLLAKEFIGDGIYAVLCGFIFAFSPYKTSHLLEHYHLLLTATVPFVILLIYRMIPDMDLKKINWNGRYIFLIILMAVVTLLSDYYTSFYLVFFGIFLLLFLVSYKFWDKLNLITKIILLSGLFIAGHLIVEPMHIQGRDDKGAFYNTADLTSVLIPAENSAIYNSVSFDHLREKTMYKGSNEQVMFLGYALVLLLILGIGTKLNIRMRSILFLSLIFFLLALPKLKFMGHSLSYSPTAGFHYLAFFNNIRNPTRAVALLYLFLPILVFYRIKARSFFRNPVVAFSILLLIMAEYWPSSYPFINRIETADFVDQLKIDDEVDIVWQIPTGIADGFEARGEFDVQRLQDQIEHKKSILGGYISRVPASTFEAFEQEELFKITNDLALGRKMLHDLSTVNIESFLLRYEPDLIIIAKGNPELKQLLYTLFKDHIDHHKTNASKEKEYDLIYLDHEELRSTADL